MPLVRDDIKVIVSDTCGLSRSRNIAIYEATGEICLIADDDTVFDSCAFDRILQTFADSPQTDIALFRITGKEKRYPAARTRLRHRLPRGYWVTSSEIAFRTSSVRNKIEFREDFGLGAPRFTAAEDAFFIADALRCGMTVDMIPCDICSQPGSSSGERPYTADGGFPAAQGAYIRHIHGFIPGLPRIVLFAYRAKRTRKAPFLFTLKHAFKGFTCKTA